MARPVLWLDMDSSGISPVKAPTLIRQPAVFPSRNVNPQPASLRRFPCLAHQVRKDRAGHPWADQAFVFGPVAAAMAAERLMPALRPASSISESGRVPT